MNNNELRDKAVEDGIRFAKQIFVTRGNKSEMHITQANLAAYLTIAFENGARWARTMPRVVIVMDGGIIQEVLSTENVEIGVIDYDVEDMEPKSLADIPQDNGKPEKAYVTLHDASVMAERTNQLFDVINDNTQ